MSEINQLKHLTESLDNILKEYEDMVASSNVSSIEYDKETSTLFVEFLTGAEYEYYDVPEDIYIGLRDAPSVGSYLHYNVKGVYDYSRLS